VHQQEDNQESRDDTAGPQALPLEAGYLRLPRNRVTPFLKTLFTGLAPRDMRSFP
jgi:hypothetical protein